MIQQLLYCIIAFGLGHTIVSATSDTMYVFAYSWTPQFCKGHTYPGCISSQYYWQKYLTIHGLWPQYIDSGYPSYCTTEKFNSTLLESEIGIDNLVTFWPDVQYSITDPVYPQFWEHEWTKHGTCSGLSQYSYFTSAIDLAIHYPTPTLITNNIGKNISTTELREAFSGGDVSNISLQCSNGIFLNGAYFCFGRDVLSGKPTHPQKCPSDVLKEDTCTHTEVTIISL